MNSIKWKCKNWIVYFKKFDNFHLIHLIVKKLDVFNFHPIFLLLFSLTAIVITITCEILTRFSKSKHQKWEYHREEKQGFERLLIFLIIKMLAKSNKIEHSEEFMAMWREEQTLWDVMILYADKNEKNKKLKKKSDNFRFFQTDIFE